MKATRTTRRELLGAGMVTFAGAAGLSGQARGQAPGTSGATTEQIVRRFYKTWEQRAWGPFDVLLAENFTFTSANDDDHISKDTFKSRCWESQKDFIHHFDIERLFSRRNEAFVKYLCHTTNGKTFRNVEYVRTRGDRVEAIECYFGGHSSFPSAVSTGKS